MDISFEASEAPYYKTILNINGGIAVVAFMLSLWLIGLNTPKSFGAYKYFLLNISICAFAYDFYISVIFQPKILFPALSMCPMGLWKGSDDDKIHLHLYFAFIFLGANTVAVLSAFIYRYAILHNCMRVVLSRKFIAFLVLLHIFYETPALIAYTITNLENREKAVAAILKDWPQIEPYFIGAGCCAMSFSTSKWPLYFLILSLICFTMGLPPILWLIFRTFITLNRQKVCMSSLTFELHKQLLHSLVFQLLVPSLTIFVPFVGLVIILLIGANNVIGWGQSFYIISTYHSLFNTLMMIYFIKPYRRAIISRQQNAVIHGGSSITVSSKVHNSPRRKNNINSNSYISKF